MELQEILDDIRTKPTVPLWPHVGKALGVSRGTIYAALHRDEIQVIRVGRQYKAITASLRKRLGLEASD